MEKVTGSNPATTQFIYKFKNNAKKYQWVEATAKSFNIKLFFIDK